MSRSGPSSRDAPIPIFWPIPIPSTDTNIWPIPIPVLPILKKADTLADTSTDTDTLVILCYAKTKNENFFGS